MAVKRILIFTFIAVLLACIGIAGYYYYLLKSDFNVCEYVPEDADAVVYVNSDVAIEQFFYDRKFPKFKSKPWKKSPYFKHLESIDDLGFDYFSNAAMVNIVDIYYLIIPLKDADDFEDFIRRSEKGLYTEINEKNDYKTCKLNGLPLELRWNKRLLYVIHQRKAEQKIPESIFNVKAEKSFASGKTYLKAVDDDALIWFYKKGKVNDEFDGRDIEGNIALDKGLRIIVSDLSDKSYHNISKDSSFKNKTVFYSDPRSLSFISREFRNFCKIYLGTLIPESAELTQSRNLLIYEGSREIEKTFVTYEFDDNFNRIPIRRIEKDSVQAYTLISELKRKTSVYANHKVMDSSYLNLVPTDVHSYLNADQDFFKALIPVNFKYKVSLIQKEIDQHQVIQVDLQLDHWRSILKNELF